jgi:hypothetical protein
VIEIVTAAIACAEREIPVTETVGVGVVLQRIYSLAMETGVSLNVRVRAELKHMTQLVAVQLRPCAAILDCHLNEVIIVVVIYELRLSPAGGSKDSTVRVNLEPQPVAGVVPRVTTEGRFPVPVSGRGVVPEPQGLDIARTFPRGIPVRNAPSRLFVAPDLLLAVWRIIEPGLRVPTGAQRTVADVDAAGSALGGAPHKIHRVRQPKGRAQLPALAGIGAVAWQRTQVPQRASERLNCYRRLSEKRDVQSIDIDVADSEAARVGDQNAPG